MLSDSIFAKMLSQLTDFHFNMLILLFLVNFLCVNKFVKIPIYLSLFIVIEAYTTFNILDIKFVFSDAYELNLNLINGLFLIHPLLVYFYYAILYYLVVYLFSNNVNFFIKKQCRQHKIYLAKNLSSLYNKFANVIIVAIILGA